jgi:rhodanese-related sulfurtransferase
LNAVIKIPPAPSPEALDHFSKQLSYETDCWDVQDALQSRDPGFILLDVRGQASYHKSHIPGSINLPHRQITEEILVNYPKDTLFVVYCAGPHCNGATKAAVRLAQLGRPVKLMIGGLTGWQTEGFSLNTLPLDS